MTYQGIQVMDSLSSEEPPEAVESIDSLLERAERGDNLSEEDYERIDTANFGD